MRLVDATEELVEHPLPPRARGIRSVENRNAALAFDEELVTRRFALVPGRMSEATFWANYFARVLRERRLFKLPPLRPEPPRAGDTPPACEGAAATAVSARA